MFPYLSISLSFCFLESLSSSAFFNALAFFESFSWKFTTKDSGYKMFEDIKVLYICIMINKEYGNYCLLLQVIASITFCWFLIDIINDTCQWNTIQIDNRENLTRTKTNMGIKCLHFFFIQEYLGHLVQFFNVIIQSGREGVSGQIIWTFFLLVNGRSLGTRYLLCKHWWKHKLGRVYSICWFNIPLESGQTLIKIPLADIPFFQVLLFSVASFPFSFEIPISMQEYILLIAIKIQMKGMYMLINCPLIWLSCMFFSYWIIKKNHLNRYRLPLSELQVLAPLPAFLFFFQEVLLLEWDGHLLSQAFYCKHLFKQNQHNKIKYLKYQML